MCHWCLDQVGSCWIEAGITIRFNFCHAKLKINKKMALHMSNMKRTIDGIVSKLE